MKKGMYYTTIGIIGISTLFTITHSLPKNIQQSKHTKEANHKTYNNQNIPKKPITIHNTYYPNKKHTLTDTPDRLTILSNIIQKKQPKIDKTIARKIAHAVNKYAHKYQLPTKLIICVIERESSFQPMRTSKANCKGLMQINEKFHKEKLKKLNIKGDQIYHIDNNIHLGCMILREYYNKT